MFRVLSVIVFLLIAVPVCAQNVSVSFVIPRAFINDLPWEVIDRSVTARPIDADGDPATGEWLLSNASDLATSRWFRVVAVRNGATCSGSWFRAWRVEFGTAAIDLAHVNGRDRLLVNWLQPVNWPVYSDTETVHGVTVVDLLVPACGGI
jgi:hypothetical protein